MRSSSSLAVTSSRSSVLIGDLAWQPAARKVVKSCRPTSAAAASRIGSRSQPLRHPPHAVAIEHGRRRPRQDAIEVVARGGAEAGVEIVGDDRAVEHGDRIGLQMEVDGRAHRIRRPGTRQVEVRHLPERMHAGVRAAGPAHRDGLAGELADRLGQPALHRDAQRLQLPADERRAVVFERDAVARHGVFSLSPL